MYDFPRNDRPFSPVLHSISGGWPTKYRGWLGIHAAKGFPRGAIEMCFVEPFGSAPLAWPKLWKHHGAKAETDRINEVAREREEPWLDRYGGTIGLESALGSGSTFRVDIPVKAGEGVKAA